MSNAPNGWPCPRRSPSRQTAPSPGQAEGPSAICCSARSRSWPLRSFGTSCRVDRSIVLRSRRLPAEIDLALGMNQDGKASTTQHHIDTDTKQSPPKRQNNGEKEHDEMHLGITGTFEMIRGP